MVTTGKTAWAFLFHDAGPWVHAAKVLVYQLRKFERVKRDFVAIVLKTHADEGNLCCETTGD
jgi:hypothetical protein